MVSALAGPALAATFGPPLLDITKQCDLLSRHNATAMSECVVAESEARSEILRNWESYSDTAARKCIGLGRKARRSQYGVMAKCLAAETPAAVKPINADGAPAKP